MNRTKQLKLLDEEIRRLFFEGISESEAFTQLQSDQRFDTVRRASIQSLFKKLQKDAKKQAKVNKKNEPKRYQRNADDNLLLCEKQLIKKQDESFEGILEGRYFLALKSINGNKIELKMTDLYQNVSKEVSLLVNDLAYVYLHALYSLTGQFGLVVIWNIMNGSSFVHLVYIDLVEGKMELVQEINHDEHLSMNMHVFVDSVDRSKFVLAFFAGQRFSIIECNLFRGKVNVGEEVVLLENYDPVLGKCSYFGNQLFGLKFDDGHVDDVNHASIVVQDLTGEKRRNTLKLEPLPSNINVRDIPLRSLHSWFCDHVFIPVRFNSSGLCGIAFTEPQTRKWSVLKFATNVQITKLTFDDNCALLIHAGTHRQEGTWRVLTEVSKIYKLPIRKPEPLRYKAWLKTVAWFKKKGVADPYEQARRFLPFNSEIHTPLNVDEHENDGQA